MDSIVSILLHIIRTMGLHVLPNISFLAGQLKWMQEPWSPEVPAPTSCTARTPQPLPTELVCHLEKVSLERTISQGAQAG